MMAVQPVIASNVVPYLQVTSGHVKEEEGKIKLTGEGLYCVNTWLSNSIITSLLWISHFPRYVLRIEK